jgi:flagellar biosynthesis protein FlhG
MTEAMLGAARGTVIAVTSGKGGVGKTNVVINLAASLARLGHRVGVVDADFGLGNIDVMLGLTPTYHLGHLLSGEKTLDQIIVNGPLGVRLIPAGTGIRPLTALTPDQWQRLRGALMRVSSELDYLLIDTATGISDNVIEPLLMAERVLIVTSFEPTAVVDAYAVVKILTMVDSGKELGLIVNSARDANEAALVFRQLDVAARRFLKRGLRYYGFIVQDPAVREALCGQRLIVDHLPQAPASRCFRILASRLAGSTNGGGAGLQLLPQGIPRRTLETGHEETTRCA